MKTAFKVLALTLLGISLSFCSSTPKEDEKVDFENPQYDKYSSSGVYQDIEGESRNVSSTEYSDDDYGAVEGDDESNIFADDAGSETDIEDQSEPASMGSEPLPVETLGNSEPATELPTKSVSPKFKNGMYRVGSACTMRAQPSTSASKEGTVPKGKKLWMEAHNANWVKVFKKSGPVFINKVCL